MPAGALDQRSLAAKAFAGLATQVLLKARGLLILPFYARLLTRDEMGVVVTAGAVCGLLAPLLALGLPTGYLVQAGGPAGGGRSGRAWTTVAGVVAVVTLGGVVVFELALLGFGQSASTTSLRPHAAVVGLWLAATALRDIALAPAQLRQETGYLTRWYLLTEYGGAVLAIVLMLRGGGAGAALWGTTAALTIGVLFGLVLSLRGAGADAGFDGPFLRSALVAGLPLLCTTAGEWAYQGVDRLVLGYYHGKAVVGTYGIAHSLASAVLIVGATLSLVFLPAALHARRTDAARLPRFFEESLRLVAALLGVFVVGACLLSRWGVPLLAGAAHADAARVLPLVVLGYCCLTLIQFLRLVPMVVEGRTRAVAAGYLAVAVIAVIADFVLIPKAGMKGAALGGLSAQAVGVVLMGAVGRQSLSAWRWWRPLGGPIAATAVVASAAWALPVPVGASFPRAMGATALAIVAYAAVARLTGGLTAGDARLVRSLRRPGRPPGGPPA